MPITTLGSPLCCQLPLCQLPVKFSSEGDTQSCCIMIGIMFHNKHKPAVLGVYCVKSTAPTCWTIVDFHIQPLRPKHGLCCGCRNWRYFLVAMLTSARQTKLTIVLSLLDRNAHDLLYSGRYVCTFTKVWLSESIVGRLLCCDVYIHSTNKVEVHLCFPLKQMGSVADCLVVDARFVKYVLVLVLVLVLVSVLVLVLVLVSVLVLVLVLVSVLVLVLVSVLVLVLVSVLVLVLVLVAVSVSVSKLETLLHRWTLDWS